MLDTLRSWFADPTFQLVYIGVFVVAMVGPMIAIARWYHRNIGATEGGRKLMDWQRTVGVHEVGGLDKARDIERGAHGAHARGLQRRVYVLVTYWLVGVAVLALPLIFLGPGT